MTRLLFNCDDFGKTAEVNAAVLKAHCEGVLGSASLMVTGDAFSEAVEIAKAHPALKVGLHLALSQARAVLPKDRVPDLVGEDGCFHPDPATMGIRLAFCSRAKRQVREEIAAQFDRFVASGLTPAHIDGHHHLHMHPFIFDESLRLAEKLGFARIRVAKEFGDPLPLRRDSTGFIGKWARHYTFSALSARCFRKLRNSKVKALNGVLGLWETGRMSEDYLIKALPQLPEGEWEVYSHIGSIGSEEELSALLSTAVKKIIVDRKIEILK
jgi:hopanoid biosynthesis associated protein HpnK